LAFIIKQIKGDKKNKWFFGVPCEGTPVYEEYIE